MKRATAEASRMVSGSGEKLPPHHGPLLHKKKGNKKQHGHFYQFHARQPAPSLSNVSTGSSAQASAGIPRGIPVEKWFSDKFSAAQSPYQVFIGEYDQILRKTKYGKGKDGPEYPPFLYPNRSFQSRTIQSHIFTVNAHNVEGLNGKSYIACEGPNTSSVYDFWEMVWQEKVEAIFMVNTPYEERRNPKTWDSNHETIDYWPTEPGKTKTYTPWKIQCVSSVLKAHPQDTNSYTAVSNDYVYRLTRLTLVESNPIIKPRPREIIHICHYRWPDGQIPEPPPSDPENYAAGGSLLLDIMRKELGNASGPLVIHCHAGIGRTGVCIALDIAAERLISRHYADVRETVWRLREQRPKSVMNIWQYSYINLILADLAIKLGLVKGDTCHLHAGVEVEENTKKEGKEIASVETCKVMVLDAWDEMINDFQNIHAAAGDAFDGFEDDDDYDEEGEGEGEEEDEKEGDEEEYVEEEDI